MPKSSKLAPTVGDFVHIVFDDHCENFHDVMTFEVVGKLVQKTRWAYIVKTWYYSDPVQAAIDRNQEENEHKFAIVKRAVKEIRVLK